MLRHGFVAAAAVAAAGRAVLFDRDGTLVHDEPYNGDPEQVGPSPGPATVLDGLRAAGLRLGVISNQSGIGRGLLTADAGGRGEPADRASCWARSTCGRSARTRPDDGCTCRKPLPGHGVARGRGAWRAAVRSAP